MASETDEFMNNVKVMIDEETQLWLQHFKDGVAKLKTPQKGALKLDESSVIESGDRLLTIIQNRFEVNMAKFELYARRNVFCPSSAPKPAAGSSSDSLEEMRKTHAQLLQSQLHLSVEHAEAVSVRDGMREALQALRDGFAELKLGAGKTLAEVVGVQTEQLRKLHDLSSRANDLAKAINVGMGGSDAAIVGAVISGPSIAVGTSEELAFLSENLKNR